MAPYRMPAEWEAHQGTWLAWPHNQETWQDALETVERVYARVVHTLAAGEEVHILVNDRTMERRARSRLGLWDPMHAVQFHAIPTDDAWCRDYGATVLQSLDPHGAMPARLAIDWGFNAWGGKYPPWDNDNRVAARMARALGIPPLSGSMILEGGSIDVNGEGLLMTTATCLLNANRNPLLSRTEIEAKLARLLGIQHVIWLTGELAGDDTDGHIDQVARFVQADRVAYLAPGSTHDPNYRTLREQLGQLEHAASRHHLELVELPSPPWIERLGRPLPASYANFYIGNQVVLVPQFHVGADDAACEVIAGQFPGRRVVGIDCTDLIEGLGAIHCLTQQIPAAPES